MASGTLDNISGTVERTERAFRQDAELAMGADAIRAIVELVTNSDDAYVLAGRGKRAPIRVSVERRRKNSPSLITVKDKAGGMTLAEMRTKLAREGARTSGFESGKPVRGLLGRGAKDCARFGRVTWTCKTPRENAEFELQPTGQYRGHRVEAQNRPRICGTEVVLQVESRFAIKNHENLREALMRHHGLRPCLSDREGREVYLEDVNQDRSDHLVYLDPRGDLLEERVIEIPGYPGETATVRLWRAPENLDDGWDREYWRHGVLVTSGRAAYDVFAGKFEREPWSQYIGWFFGQADVPAIANLINEYDDRLQEGLEPSPSNPTRLVPRDRRGLAGEHPFVRELFRTLENVLQPHLEKFREEREATSRALGLSEDTKRRLRELGRAIGRFFEDEEQSASPGRGGVPPVGLSIIPSAQEVEPGKTAWFSARYRPAAAVSSVVAKAQLRDGVGTVLPAEFELTDRGGYFSKAFAVLGLDVDDIAEVEVEVDGQVASCIVACRIPEIPPAVIGLQFEHASYRIRDGGRRELLVLAPWDLIAEEPEVHLHLAGDSTIRKEGDMGRFGFDDHRQCGAALLGVRGTGIGSRARISIEIGGETAVAELLVTAEGSGGVQVEIDPKPFPQRALWDGNTLKVSARDKSVARYLGGKGWPGQHSLHFRTMLAEVVAFHCARRIVETRHKDHQLRPVDLYRAHLQLEQKCLARFHTVLIGGAELGN